MCMMQTRGTEAMSNEEMEQDDGPNLTFFGEIMTGMIVRMIIDMTNVTVKELTLRMLKNFLMIQMRYI